MPKTHKEKDPVCGMDVESSHSPKAEFKHKQYCFCSKQCLEKFKSAPEKFAK